MRLFELTIVEVTNHAQCVAIKLFGDLWQNLP